MIRPLRLLILMAAPLFLALALAGCGASPNVGITVKLLKGGAPYAPPQGQRVGVTLYAMDARDAVGKPAAGNEPYTAALNPADGSFRVPGRDGDGIPPGRYRVAISQKLRREALATAKGRGKLPADRERDTMADRFGPANSPIVCELRSSGELAVDLDRPSEASLPH